MSWERQIHLTTPWLRVTPTKETSCINEPRQQLWENDCVQFHAVATWSTHSRTSSTWPWFISAGLWCLKWRKSLLSHGQGHPALRRSLHGKQRPWHSKNSLCFESRRVCIPALLLFLLLDHRWAIDFPKWPCEKLGLLQRAAPISWTQLCSVLIDLFINCCWWE